MSSPVKKLIKTSEEESKTSDVRINSNLDEIFLWETSNSHEVNDKIEQAKKSAENKEIELAIKQLKSLSGEKIEQIEKSRIKYIIGNLLVLKGDFLEAEKELLEARNIGMKILGLAEYETAKITNLLAICCWKNGKIQKGEVFLREALSIYRMEFGGDESVEVAKIKCNLSIIKKQLGNFEEAEKLLIEALQTQKKLLTENNFEYALTLQELGILYGSTGNMSKAETLFEQSLEIQLNSINENNNLPTAIARTYTHLAIAAEARLDYKKSEDFLLKAKETLIEIHGEYSDQVAANEMSIAAVLMKQNEFKKAENFLKHAELIFLKIYSKNHLKIAQVYKLLGSLYLHEQQFSSAEEFLKNSLNLFQIYENTFVEQFFIFIELAELFEKLQEFEKENDFYEQALILFKSKITGGNYPNNIVESMEKLASFYYKKQDYSICKDIYHEIIRNIKLIYEEHHSKYKHAVSILDEIDDLLGSDFNDPQNDDSSFDSSFDAISEEDSSAINELELPTEQNEQSISSTEESFEEEDKTQRTTRIGPGESISNSTATDDLDVTVIIELQSPVTVPSPTTRRIPIIDINPDNEEDSTSIDDPTENYKLPHVASVSHKTGKVPLNHVNTQIKSNCNIYLFGGVGLGVVGLGLWYFLSNRK